MAQIEEEPDEGKRRRGLSALRETPDKSLDDDLALLMATLTRHLESLQAIVGDLPPE